MNPTIEIIINKDRLACIIDLLQQASEVGSPNFKLSVSQDGSFMIVPLVKFELKAQR